MCSFSGFGSVLEAKRGKVEVVGSFVGGLENKTDLYTDYICI